MLAIHVRKNSFSDRWIEYCDLYNIHYVTTDIFRNDIIRHLEDNNVKYLLAHISHDDYKTSLIAHSILLTIENMGIRVFPNQETFWHFDDKISQKYFFEAKKIPHASMHVFYNRSDAYNWLSTASFPVVFKLRGGASSSNVILVKNINNAKFYLRKIFGRGIKPIRSVSNGLKTKFRIHSEKKDWIESVMRIPFNIKTIVKKNLMMRREKGYLLVQEFLPNNDFDTRVVVVGDKAFAFRRINRPNDFRASGSGIKDLDQTKIDKCAINLAFQTVKKINSQSMAFDFLSDINKKPVIVEMSYACPTETISKIGGYWDSSLVFHEDTIRLEDVIIEHVLESYLK